MPQSVSRSAKAGCIPGPGHSSFRLNSITLGKPEAGGNWDRRSWLMVLKWNEGQSETALRMFRLTYRTKKASLNHDD